MTYKIGTRVRKVRSETNPANIGATGIVCAGPDVNGHTLEQTVDYDCDIYIKQDGPWKGVKGIPYPAGTVSMSISCLWEPIVPEGAAPADLSKCNFTLDGKYRHVEQRTPV